MNEASDKGCDENKDVEKEKPLQSQVLYVQWAVRLIRDREWEQFYHSIIKKMTEVNNLYDTQIKGAGIQSKEK